MATAPPGFRYIDIHTHLHPPWLWKAIRRWFEGRAGWEFRYPTDPDLVARFLGEQGVERFVFFSYAHKPGLASPGRPAAPIDSHGHLYQCLNLRQRPRRDAHSYLLGH